LAYESLVDRLPNGKAIPPSKPLDAEAKQRCSAAALWPRRYNTMQGGKVMCKRWLFLMGILAVCSLANEGRQPTVEPVAPRWLSDWEEARKAARASGKPLFVVFRCEH
jgi:hypothetical protein